MLRFLCFFFCLLQAQSLMAQDLFLLIGQSNMAGRAPIEAEDTPILPQVYLINANNQMVQAKNPLNLYSTIRKDKVELQRLGPGYHFAKKLREKVKDSLVLLVQARGGTAIEKWLRGSNDAYYESTLNRLQNALNTHPNLRLKAVLWQQGGI